MKDTIIGIDVGTSSIKCNLYDLNGKNHLNLSSEYELINPSPGIIEIDPDKLWKTIARLLSNTVKHSSGKYNIIGIGLCAMMIMPVFLDRDNSIVRPVIHWFDERLNRQCIELKREGRDKILSEFSGSILTGESTVNAMFWLKKNEPEAYRRISKFFMVKDYIRYRLTEKVLTDFGDASGSLMLDTRKWRWSEEVITELGLNPDIFPEIRKPGEIGGYVTKAASTETGLKEGTPVAVGSGDGITTIFGLGVYNDGEVGITVGSAGVVGVSTINFPQDEKLRTYIFCHPFGDRWYSMMATAASGEVLSWYKNSMLRVKNISYIELDREARQAPPGTEGLIFLPYILGSRNPHSNPEAVGMFLGMRHKHDRGYMTRAVMEGILYELLDLYEVQKEIIGQKSTGNGETKLSGGIVNSFFWTQLLADILQSPLVTTEIKELGTLGSSIFASKAIGFYDSYEKALQCMVRIENTIKPNISLKQIYKEKFTIFREIYQILEKKFYLIT